MNSNSYQFIKMLELYKKLGIKIPDSNGCKSDAPSFSGVVTPTKKPVF